MHLTKAEWAFCIYFLPLFALKLLDITSENWLLKGVGVLCVLGFFMCTLNMKYNAKLFRNFLLLLLYALILVFTTRKQGIFFSVVMLIGLNGIYAERRIYRICLFLGIFFLLVACWMNFKGSEVTRFVNGEWVAMIKRSNLLFVSFTAVLCLYLYIYKEQLTKKRLFFLALPCYLMYVYVGSRTGLLAVLFLLILIVFLRNQAIHDCLVIKYLCVLFPLVCLLFCIYSGLLYNDSPFLNLLDMMLQGRINQNSAYLERYDITLFGQPIYESTDVNDYWVLDCAYMDMLLCSGLLFTILWILLNMCTIHFFYKRNQMVEVAVLMMYALYGITETFLPNCFLNMSFFLFAQYLYRSVQRNESIS